MVGVAAVVLSVLAAIYPGGRFQVAWQGMHTGQWCFCHFGAACSGGLL